MSASTCALRSSPRSDPRPSEEPSQDLPRARCYTRTNIQAGPLRNIHILLLFKIALRTRASGLLSLQVIFRGEQCTTGALLAPMKAGGKRRVVADITKLSVGREAYYT